MSLKMDIVLDENLTVDEKRIELLKVQEVEPGEYGESNYYDDNRESWCCGNCDNMVRDKSSVCGCYAFETAQGIKIILNMSDEQIIEEYKEVMEQISSIEQK